MQLVKTCPKTGERIAVPLPSDYGKRALEKRKRLKQENGIPEVEVTQVVSATKSYAEVIESRFQGGQSYDHLQESKKEERRKFTLTPFASGNMLKRTIDLNTLSTWEIQMMRHEENSKKQKKTMRDKVDLKEILPMTKSAMIDFILDAKSTTEMLTKHMRIQTCQKVEAQDLIMFELHGYAKFNERAMMKSLLDRTIGRDGPGFMDKLVKYAAEYCIDQYRYSNCTPWDHLLAMRSEQDWPAMFQKCIKSSPNLELALLVTLITLIPEQRSKHIPKIYSLMAKSDDIPNCFVWLSRIMVKSYGSTLPDKNDMDICTRRYLTKVYAHVQPLTAKNSAATVLTEAQRQFALISNKLLDAGLKIVNEKDQEMMKNLISNPRCEVTETPCHLFIEFLVQFVKLGVFSFSQGDKLIAWHYYYDDRWMGYDRPDLFGANFQLYDQFMYTESFRYKKKGSMEHPHMMDLTLATRAFDWMSKDEELYKAMMDKFGDEDMIQLFAISLAFCGFFDHIIKLYEQYKDNMQTKEGFMCLHMCYLFACAKKPGMLKEAVITWARIVKHATKWNYLACIAFREKSFPLPSFVRVKFAGHFATRILRNCLWETALAEGEEGWKKYGLLILLICESLEDSFLNHQMVRVLFQKVPKENWNLILRPGFERCIRRGETFNQIMTTVFIDHEELLEELRTQDFLPDMRSFPKRVPTPGYMKIINMLREKDPVVSAVVDWIPEELLEEEVVEKVPEEEVKEEIDENSMDSSVGQSDNDSHSTSEAPEDTYSPTTKHGEMSRNSSFVDYSNYEGNGIIGNMSPARSYNGDDDLRPDIFSEDYDPIEEDFFENEGIVVRDEPLE